MIKTQKYQTLIISVFKKEAILGTLYLSLSLNVLHLLYLPEERKIFHVKPVTEPGEQRQAIKFSVSVRVCFD